MNKATRDKLVDVFLEHAGTPRRELFEYPHRDDDSRTMIHNADLAVGKFLRILTESNVSPD